MIGQRGAGEGTIFASQVKNDLGSANFVQQEYKPHAELEAMRKNRNEKSLAI